MVWARCRSQYPFYRTETFPVMTADEEGLRYLGVRESPPEVSRVCVAECIDETSLQEQFQQTMS